MAATTTGTGIEWDSDEWELVNDDGFVYKRKRRRTDPSAVARPADPAPDPELEVKQRRERKRATLLKVREKYEKEIALWENLSNTLRAMEQSAREKQAERENRESEGEERNKQGEREGEGASLADQLLLQVEAQETMINHIKNLCDVAESICDAQEEKTKQSFLDLPIWESPRELMASLCED